MNNPYVYQIITEETFTHMMKDRGVRRAITRENFLYFFHFYYAHYVKYPTADFQKEIMHLLERSDRENLYIVAFRGSGKSTMVTTAYPLWAILGKQQKKFVTIFCQTQAQARLHMMNLRRELENNALLKNDLGPFKEDSDEWGSYTLTFSQTGARIIVASSEQSIRGIRQGENRPDLIICDDVEDIASTKTREGRDKTYNWLRGDVIPGGDIGTRLIVVGNLLHEDSLLMRLKADIEEDRAEGTFCRFPLVTEKGSCLWSGKFPDQIAIDAERKKIGNDIAWQREYMLNIVSDVEQVIDKSWIKHYDALPNRSSLKDLRIGVDLAITEKATGDYTAMVSILAFNPTGEEDGMYLYVLPNIVNDRMDFPKTVERCLELNNGLRDVWMRPTFAIENVAYQRALPQHLQTKGLQVVEVRPTSDKRSRLALTSHYIQTGRILFPIVGCERLIEQITHFGTEKHDDLADAFAYAVLSFFEAPRIVPNIYVI